MWRANVADAVDFCHDPQKGAEGGKLSMVWPRGGPTPSLANIVN